MSSTSETSSCADRRRVAHTRLRLTDLARPADVSVGPLSAMRARTTSSNLLLACLLGGLGVLVLHMTVGLGGQSAEGPIDDGVYDVLVFGAAFAVIARAVAF